jgi:hypothetical protein
MTAVLREERHDAIDVAAVERGVDPFHQRERRAYRGDAYGRDSLRSQSSTAPPSSGA